MIAQLKKQADNNKLPHAILFVGVGCDNTVMEFAHSLLSVNTQAKHLLAANTHPDYQIVQPEGKSHRISVDAVREMLEWCTQTPQIADKKIIVILGADTLNPASSNALLKTLEEPPGNCYFFLTTNLPAAILPTIRSRCQTVQLNTAEKEKPSSQNDFFKDCDALLAKKVDPLSMAAKWQKEDVMVTLDALYEYFTGQIRSDQAMHYFEYLDKIMQLRKTFLQHPTINTQLQLESLLINISV